MIRMIKVSNVIKTYGKKSNKFVALNDVSLEIENSSLVGIVGKSGSGKSTLMHVISGLDNIDSGKINIDGIDISAIKNRELNKFRNKKIGFVFQEFYLQETETVLNNVLLPLEIAGISFTKRHKIAINALKNVDMINKINEKTVNLSGGEKQRVCIARAIVNDPDIIFADEPTGNLDTENSQNIIDLLINLNTKHSKTVVIVTHDKDVSSICSKLIHIQDGKIVDAKI